MSRAPSRRSVPAIVLVAAAAALWGTDALFRRALALELPAGVVVFYEHLFLTLACLPLLARVPWRQVRWSPRVLGSLVLIGAGASATATFLFTLAFRYGDPTTPLLLQKLQPLIAVGAAWLLLGERPRVRLGGFAALAIVGAYLISVPDPARTSVAQLAPALLAVGAAALWGLGTVLGRGLSTTFAPAQLTALRFAIGLPASALVVLVDQGPAGFAAVTTTDLPGLVALAAVPGLLALWLYYRGLAGTPASAATLAELAFPLSAIVINRIAFGTTLTTTQWIGMGLLAGTLVAVSRLSQRGYEHVGVEAQPPQPALQR
ncbi:DMT family transporter [Egicoccus sp. AB-alg6-2]|uniref:DMT family transporter n=1 Tax=Egicoccus sp. AB-alg6-2 TaxID=3242692 RepID=UPI00359EDD00